jgi:hypothetical protein
VPSVELVGGVSMRRYDRGEDAILVLVFEIILVAGGAPRFIIWRLAVRLLLRR